MQGLQGPPRNPLMQGVSYSFYPEHVTSRAHNDIFLPAASLVHHQSPPAPYFGGPQLTGVATGHRIHGQQIWNIPVQQPAVANYGYAPVAFVSSSGLYPTNSLPQREYFPSPAPQTTWTSNTNYLAQFSPAAFAIGSNAQLATVVGGHPRQYYEITRPLPHIFQGSIIGNAEIRNEVKQGEVVQVLEPVEAANNKKPESSTVSTDGVSLSFLEEFIKQEMATVQDKTTNEVCDFLKSRTGPKKCSYIELLRLNGEHRHVGSANFFVSHAWRGKFTELIAAIRKIVINKGLSFQSTYLWIDIFVVNQHMNITDFNFWTDSFKLALKVIGNSIVVLSPWRNPLWVERAWCLFEYYSMITCGIDHTFSFPSEDENDFVKSLEKGEGLLQAVAGINMEKAAAFKKEDEERIKAFVTENVGFVELNKLVGYGLRKWALCAAEEHLDRMDMATRKTSQLWYMRGVLLRQLGEFQRALDVQEERLDALLELDDDGTCEAEIVSTDYEISVLYRELGRFEEAEELTSELLKLEGGDSVYIANALNEHGLVLEKKGQFLEALEALSKSLQMNHRLFGDCHANVADSQNNIGNVLEKLGKYDRALESHELALKVRTTLFGSNHPCVADTQNNIGEVYRQLGRFDEALKMYKSAQTTYITTYGNSHLSTALTYKNIGNVYLALEKFDDSLENYKKALQISEECSGSANQSVADAQNNIGVVYQNLGRYEEALQMFEKALRTMVECVGGSHPSVAATYKNMGLVYNSQGKFDEALRMHGNALQIEQASLGDGHASVGMTKFNMALAHANLGDAGRARTLYHEAHRTFLGTLGPDHHYTTLAAARAQALP